jgi:hypothetical protein
MRLRRLSKKHGFLVLNMAVSSMSNFNGDTIENKI